MLAFHNFMKNIEKNSITSQPIFIYSPMYAWTEIITQSSLLNLICHFQSYLQFYLMIKLSNFSKNQKNKIKKELNYFMRQTFMNLLSESLIMRMSIMRNSALSRESKKLEVGINFMNKMESWQKILIRLKEFMKDKSKNNKKCI